MHDSLRRLFRALYILPRRPISEEFLSAVDQVRHRLRKNLQDYEPFLAVKAQRNLAITRYFSYPYEKLFMVLEMGVAGQKLTCVLEKVEDVSVPVQVSLIGGVLITEVTRLKAPVPQYQGSSIKISLCTALGTPDSNTSTAYL